MTATASPPQSAGRVDPLVSRIVSQARVISRKRGGSRFIGILTQTPIGNPVDVVTANGKYLVRPCATPLAARMAIQECADSSSTVVIVTALDAQTLGSDVTLRLAGQQLFPLDSWRIVRDRFDAPRGVDHRVRQHPCLADWLAECADGIDPPKATNGFLDADTVWPFLLGQAFGMTERAYDPVELLVWSCRPEAARQWRSLEQDRRDAIRGWFTIKAGPVAQAMLSAFDRPLIVDLLTLGLVLDVVYRDGQPADLARAQTACQVRIEERFFGGRAPPAETLRSWGELAVRAVELHLPDERRRQEVVRDADELIKALDAMPLAALSRISRGGFERRLEDFADMLDRAIEHPDAAHRARLRAAFQRLKDHHEAIHDKPRFQRAEMAVRLVRWLTDRARGSEGATPTFAESAAAHARDGGFVTWARECARSGEPLAAVEQVLGKLVARVSAALDEDAERFATLLAGWLGEGANARDVLPVEKLLDAVVAPLATHAPVLLLVIDGMSAGVFQQLMAGLGRHWYCLAPTSLDGMLPGIAAVPSATEFSRTSLLAGKLMRGGQVEEKAEFERNPALVGASRKNAPPRLFQKGDLSQGADGSLAEAVRQEIRSPERRIVGVVINAIDDLLAKGDQVHITWSLDSLRHLPTILHDAREAGRLVVLTSDHGHVLETASEYRSNGEGERWRRDTSSLDDGEVRLAGNRVLVEGGRLIAAWREQIRYTTATKRGYHGGASPQEMIAPIAVLAPSDEGLPAGWDLARGTVPAWWDEPQNPAPEEPPSIKIVIPSSPRPGMLFDPETGEVPRPHTQRATSPPATWIADLLASEVFQAQRKLVGRAGLTDSQIETFLRALDGRGGVMTVAALGRALQLAPFRLTGLVATLTNVLNIDGFRVLGRSEDAQEITLDIPLLKRQFALVKPEEQE
jgi:hypothetical protein